MGLSVPPGQPDRPLGDTVTIDISGPVAATWHMVASEQGWSFAEAVGNQMATIDITTDEAWRLLTNNLSPERQAALTTSGDSVLLEVLRNTRAIIGSPK